MNINTAGQTSPTRNKVRLHRRVFGIVAAIVALSGPFANVVGAEELLAYDDFGYGPEKVLVLHSWIDHAGSFDAVRPYLDESAYTFVFADLRGYGDSRHLSGEYSSEEAASDAFALADALGWDEFHVVGHSMSGMIAQRIALIDAVGPVSKVKSVTAVTPVTPDGYPADDDTKAFLQNAIHNVPLMNQLAGGLTGGRLPQSWGRRVARNNMSTSRPDAMKGYYNMWVNEDFSRDVQRAQVQTPIRVIGGRQDLPGFQEDYYRQTFAVWYPNIEFRYIDDAGHFPMYETPVYLAALVQEFIARHSASAESRNGEGG